MSNTRVEVHGVKVAYRGDTVLDVDRLVFEGPGLYQLLGPNGAGKSTLIRVIVGLIKPSEGEVLINGVRVEGKPELAGKYIGYVPQHEHVGHFDFPVTPFDLVASALLLRRPWPRVKTPRWVREHVEKVLDEVGLPRDSWHKSVSELSGGQLQRVLIARALVHNPPILLMDEPLSAVDPRGRVELARVIGELSKDRLVIVASHDPALLLEYTKGVVLLNRRVVATGHPDEVLRVEVLKRVYGDVALIIERHVHICDSHYVVRKGR
ncbi:metal ABC transporter ATP-binding protein [Pyrolobus fumarii]|uniref:metal ABC transporter ATP-binding protein n=1 Tax=Pyrolobus fumarii TaxID=54252 RepID=UPI001FCB1E28|nr:metal ABC transporter ATP-binding protein [Pyrolobus fumarii]